MRRGSGQYTKGRTHYQPLVDHLAASSEAMIVLSYPAIETIIVGWSAWLNRRNRCVVFTRDAEE